jgi:hypothetical protein
MIPHLKPAPGKSGKVSSRLDLPCPDGDASGVNEEEQ